MIAVLLLAAAAATTPIRPPVFELAYELGRAHAFRQACEGAEDGYWRERMGRVIAAERPDPAQRPRLVARFNAGFAAGRAAAPECDGAARAGLREATAKAAELARALAQP